MLIQIGDSLWINPALVTAIGVQDNVVILNIEQRARRNQRKRERVVRIGRAGLVAAFVGSAQP